MTPSPPRRWEVPPWLVQLSDWLWRIGLILLSIYVFLRVFDLLRLVTVPILFALVFTALLWPLRVRLTSLGTPNFLATWLILLVAGGAVIGVGWLAVYGVVDQLSNSADWQSTRAEVETWLMDGPAGLSEQEIDDLEGRVQDSVTTGVMTVNVGRARLVGEVLSATLLTAVLVFFFVKDGPEMWSFVMERVRPNRRPSVESAGQAAFGALGGYARGVAITGLVDALLVGIVLMVVGVPLALPLALLTFFGAFLPIIGATLAGSLSTVVALVTVGPRAAIIVAIATFVIQQVEGDVVLPLVMGSQVRLHPSVILVVLAAGGALGGLIGALVAVPLAAMASAALRQFRVPTLDGAALEASRSDSG